MSEQRQHDHSFDALRRDAETAFHQLLARCGKDIDPDLVVHSGMFFAEVDEMRKRLERIEQGGSNE